MYGVMKVGVPPSELVETDKEAEALLALCLEKIKNDPEGYIGFDTETYGKKLPTKAKTLDWMTDVITMWSLSFKYKGVYRRWAIAAEYFYFFAPVLEHPDAKFAVYNLKYDAHIAWNCGVNIWNSQPLDVMALLQMHEENLLQYTLKKTAPLFCGLEMTPYSALFDLDVHGNKAKEFATSLLDLPKEPVADYASYDAYVHLEVFSMIQGYLQNTVTNNEGTTLWELFMGLERHMTEVLWRMERRGLPIDIDTLNSKVPILEKRMSDLKMDIVRDVGFPINVMSNPQIAEYFFTDNILPSGVEGLGLEPIKMTKGGAKGPQPSVDKSVMEGLASAGYIVAKNILSYRKIDKKKGTYFDFLKAAAEHYPDGRVHPSFKQLGAVTGRLAATAPNSMNMPRPDNDEWGIRELFVAPPGYKLIVADYAQIEMRIMADMSGDESMLGAILDGKDLHAHTVDVMNADVTYEEVVAAKNADDPTDRQKELKRMRQDGKSIGFGILYGAGPPTISANMEISDEEATEAANALGSRKLSRKITYAMKKNPLLTEDTALLQIGKYDIAADKIRQYLEAFPGVKSFMDGTPEQCRYTMSKNDDGSERDWSFEVPTEGAAPVSKSGHHKPFGYVQTLTGRFRRLRDINHSNRFFRAEAERQSVNTKIQGSAADIAKAAMVNIEFDLQLEVLEFELINQVHDEIVGLVPIEYAEEAKVLVKEIMEHPFGPDVETLKVPIPVDIHIVDNWAQAK